MPIAEIEAAIEGGVDGLDMAAGGIGGCPFTGAEQVSNLDTAAVLPWLADRGLVDTPDSDALAAFAAEAARISAWS